MTEQAPADWGPRRSRTITWYDPAVTAAGMQGRSGLEFLQAMVAGELPGPPIGSHFDLRAVSVTAGEVVFACTPDDSAYNPIGLIHGGLLCTLLDSVAGCAVHTTLPAGVGYTSIEISVRYLRTRPRRRQRADRHRTHRQTRPTRRRRRSRSSQQHRGSRSHRHNILPHPYRPVGRCASAAGAGRRLRSASGWWSTPSLRPWSCSRCSPRPPRARWSPRRWTRASPCLVAPGC